MAERVLQLLPTPDASRRARAFVERQFCGDLEGDAMQDALLLVSELVAARLGVGQPDPDRRISVRVRREADVVVFHVTDTGGEEAWWPPDGHGPDRLRLLDLLSAGWGVEPGPPFTIWFASWRSVQPDAG